MKIANHKSVFLLKKEFIQTMSFNCDSCDSTYKSKPGLRAHYKTAHLEERHKCNICSITRTQRSALFHHMREVHGMNGGNKKIKCNKCDYTTSHKVQLKTHIEAIHENIKRFKCTFCTYETYHKIVMKRHIDSLHGKEGKKNKYCF